MAPRVGARLLSIVLAAGLMVAACSGSPAATLNVSSVAGVVASPAAGGGTAAGGGGAGGGAGDLSKVDACSLLKPAEIEQVVGITGVAQGVNQDSDVVKQCEWDSADSTTTVGLTVRPYTDEDWQTILAFPKASPVSGLGDAAYRNSPLTGDLSVKHHGYEIDLAIPTFSSKSQAQIDQATDALMKLVLTRM